MTVFIELHEARLIALLQLFLRNVALQDVLLLCVLLPLLRLLDLQLRCRC